MNFCLNYFIAGIIGATVTYYFDFTLLGWLFGIIVAAFFTEFINPFIAIGIGTLKIYLKERNLPAVSNLNDIPKLKHSFNYFHDKESNSIFYYHKNKVQIQELKIILNTFLVQEKEEMFRFGINLNYNYLAKGAINDMLLFNKSVKQIDNRAEIITRQFNVVNAETYIFVSLKNKHRELFSQEGGELTIIFSDSQEKIKIEGELLNILRETYYLSLSLNSRGNNK